jgi:hypothetical protein
MRRRNFLGGITGAIVSPFMLRRGFAQAAKQAAVVIGVNKAGDLPILTAAASGARAVEQWLQSQGVEVHTFADDTGPVYARALIETTTRLVNLGTFDQLIVYFAGHGFLNAGSEVWLLSEAPENSNEAVNLQECVNNCRESGLSNVIFISDACRSTPDSLRSARLFGSVLFPNLNGSRPIRPEVDRFFAALPGHVADEAVAVSSKKYEGIYTSALLDAFKKPYDGMVHVVNGVKVIPDWVLKGYLAKEVPRRALGMNLSINQIPDANVESRDSFYFGRVADDVAVIQPLRPFVTPDTTTFQQVADRALGEARSPSISKSFNFDSIDRSEKSAIFDKAQAQVSSADTSISFETGSGIRVVGTSVNFVATGARLKAQRLRPGSSRDGELIRIDPGDQPAGSVAIGFADGGGTVLAALRGYVATVVVDDQGHVVNVNYLRSGAKEDQTIIQLRATVATSAKFGVFRIEGDRATRTAKARELADEIRVGKSIDPTLGIYAAYAYADADILDQVQSVREFTRFNLGVDLFDVAMLSGELSKPLPHDKAVPFCPMLSQGWNLLRVKRVELPLEVQRAREHIRAALWTTFDAEAINALAGALSQGKLS